jgi:hypothetical protein
MSEARRQRRIIKRIGAVLAGAGATIVLSIATDAALHATGVFPPLGQSMAGGLFVLAAAYRQVYGVAGAYLTARLAPNRPMLHALVLGVMGFVASIAGAVATWNRGAELGPKWYPLALVALAIPCAWLGGKLGEMRGARRPEGEAAQRNVQTIPSSKS